MLHLHKDYPRISVNEAGEQRYVPTVISFAGNDLGDKEALLKSELDKDLAKRLSTSEADASRSAKTWKKGTRAPNPEKAIIAQLPGFPEIERAEAEESEEEQDGELTIGELNGEGADTPILDPAAKFAPEELYEEDIPDQVLTLYIKT